MRLLVDTAELEAMRTALATGLIAGVTTNPTLLRRAALPASRVGELIGAAIEAGAGEIHVQAQAEDAAGMVAEGRRLVAADPARIRVKLVATSAGYRAAATLAADGIAVTLTAVYTLRQALAAQVVGAQTIAVYVGRLRDAGIADPVEHIGRMEQLLRAQGAAVEILAASIRDPDELAELALRGVAAATVAPPIVARLLDSEETAAAAAAFTADARAVGDG